MTLVAVQWASAVETARHNKVVESQQDKQLALNERDVVVREKSLDENVRHNKATETETKRHNVKTEQVAVYNAKETKRHNLATEKEYKRHNVVSEKETQRHNVQTEGIGMVQASASVMQAKAATRQAAASEKNAATNAMVGKSQVELNTAERSLVYSKNYGQTLENYYKHETNPNKIAAANHQNMFLGHPVSGTIINAFNTIGSLVHVGAKVN